MTTANRIIALLAAALGAAAPAGAQESRLALEDVPFFWTHYDGVEDDLLTAGLGSAGIAAATPPGFADPLRPTAGELRRLAIYRNYRALVDPAPGGGYGALFGPGVPLEPGGEPVPELIAGDEFIAYAPRPGRGGRAPVTMMVQVPDGFDPERPCIVAAPSSGSRGMYGAIGTAGEWGLKRGCAVAYTDKGTGTGAHDLGDDAVYLIQGLREDAEEAGRLSSFTAPVSDAERAAFDAEFPNRFAFEHAHSGRNPERFWGRDVLDSIGFAFVVLNTAVRADRFPDAPVFRPRNTVVIASSVSNGGGASLRAAERDGRGVIDGVAVSEPNVNPAFDDRFVIRQGDREPLERHSRTLLDYITLVNVFQGCANAAPGNAGAPLNPADNPALAPLQANRCESLREKGLLTADAPAEQAAEAQAIINGYGILPEQNVLHPSYWALAVPQAVAVTYANAYGRFGVLDSPCGYGFGATDPATGQPVPLPDEAAARLFGESSGIPPTGGISIINDLDPDGPTENTVSRSPSTGRADQNLDGALCLRALATGRDPATGARLAGEELAGSLRVRRGVQAVLADGDLHGLPAVIVTGRSDALLPPNHTSRAYYGLNRLVEGDRSNLRYYEVLNAHHLDALNGLPGIAERAIPLHHYFIQALNLMYAHLTEDAPLPPSQVVRTEPRGPGAPPVTVADNLPPVAEQPDPGDLITFDGGELFIPE